MNDMHAVLIDAAIDAYRDGSLNDEEAHLLTTALSSGNSIQLHERLQFTTLLSQAFISADDIVRSVRERIDAEQTASTMVRAVRQALPPPRRRRATSAFPLVRLALASAILVAICLIVTSTLFDHSLRAPAICHIRSHGDIDIIRNNHVIAARISPQQVIPLYAQDQLTTKSAVTLSWNDGSTIMLAAHSEIHIQPNDSDALFIKTGSLQATIATQLTEKPFRIGTSNAIIQVLGTSFHIQTTAQRTTCHLEHGTVRMERRRDHHQLILQANQSATVADDSEFITQTVNSPQAALVPPAEQPWLPLFPPDGITGWVPQYGTWSQREHIIYGNDTNKGKVRLLSVRHFEDIELTCQLQISDSELAELQVGDYNWFVEIPAHAGQWVDIHLLQVGQTLTVTANGQQLPLLPGAGLAMRPGPLGFYVMPGGSIAIRQAQFRLPTSP